MVVVNPMVTLNSKLMGLQNWFIFSCLRFRETRHFAEICQVAALLSFLHKRGLVKPIQIMCGILCFLLPLCCLILWLLQRRKWCHLPRPGRFYVHSTLLEAITSDPPQQTYKPGALFPIVQAKTAIGLTQQGSENHVVPLPLFPQYFSEGFDSAVTG